MKKVITYGTFDLLHYGHINLLRRAKDLGDYLIVGLSSDEFNDIKGKKSYFSYDQRKLLLESIVYVDEVVPEMNWEQKRSDILNNDVQTFVMGNDWEGKFDDLSDICEVVYLPRTEGISTTKVKTDLNKQR
ncbi:glycerol-3-phosphate cytidylyltransferase [Bacillus sp. USDA818B3_A]|uniref:glycerol-3-phosphate cytidylyltransferase n=1 Tax=Bacillus sp. USDA818B3_A TaxID=2698834 RepID=UPI00136A7E9F|nr:glycerol-3-phosphate cytidylyltransferase [Bacillus sp. USDA818B3_A]